ncbi:hypothetical protein C8Q74DRAFT_1193619, partial [Fomes fomentarius]
VIKKLLKSRSVKRVVNFASSCLQIYAPAVHDYYGRTLDAICTHDRTLQHNFDNNVFAGATVNLGPCTVATPHRDHLNLPFGLCAVTVFGQFDPTRSAKVKLDELKLLIQVPPYTTYLIMLAVITHSNTPLDDGETRMSMCQYTAGGLCRYHRCGMRTQKQFKSDGEKLETGEERWRTGVELLQKWATMW